MTVTLTAGHPLRPEHFLAHAAQIEAFRMRIVLVRLAARQIGRAPGVFGRHCGSFPDALNDRYAKHDELMACVQDNLDRVVIDLRKVADGDLQLARLADADNDDVRDRPSPDHVMDDVIDLVSRRDWVELRLLYGAPVAEYAQPVDVADAALRTLALEAAIAGVEPLRQLLDQVTGTPPVVAHRSASWNGIAAELRTIGEDLRRCLSRDFNQHDHPEACGYLALMAGNVSALTTAGDIIGALAVMTTTAGNLVLLTRDTIRGLLGDLCAHLIIWTAGTELVAMRILAARLAATVWHIHAYLNDLAVSLTALAAYIPGEDDEEL